MRVSITTFFAGPAGILLFLVAAIVWLVTAVEMRWAFGDIQNTADAVSTRMLNVSDRLLQATRDDLHSVFDNVFHLCDDFLRPVQLNGQQMMVVLHDRRLATTPFLDVFERFWSGAPNTHEQFANRSSFHDAAIGLIQNISPFWVGLSGSIALPIVFELPYPPSIPPVAGEPPPWGALVLQHRPDGFHIDFSNGTIRCVTKFDIYTGKSGKCVTHSAGSLSPSPPPASSPGGEASGLEASAAMPQPLPYWRALPLTRLGFTPPFRDAQGYTRLRQLQSMWSDIITPGIGLGSVIELNYAIFDRAPTVTTTPTPPNRSNTEAAEPLPPADTSRAVEVEGRAVVGMDGPLRRLRGRVGISLSLEALQADLLNASKAGVLARGHPSTRRTVMWVADETLPSEEPDVYKMTNLRVVASTHGLESRREVCEEARVAEGLRPRSPLDMPAYLASAPPCGWGLADEGQGGDEALRWAAAALSLTSTNAVQCLALRNSSAVYGHLSQHTLRVSEGDPSLHGTENSHFDSNSSLRYSNRSHFLRNSYEAVPRGWIHPSSRERVVELVDTAQALVGSGMVVFATPDGYLWVGAVRPYHLQPPVYSTVPPPSILVDGELPPTLKPPRWCVLHVERYGVTLEKAVDTIEAVEEITFFGSALHSAHTRATVVTLAATVVSILIGVTLVSVLAYSLATPMKKVCDRNEAMVKLDFVRTASAEIKGIGARVKEVRALHDSQVAMARVLRVVKPYLPHSVLTVVAGEGAMYLVSGGAFPSAEGDSASVGSHEGWGGRPAEEDLERDDVSVSGSPELGDGTGPRDTANLSSTYDRAYLGPLLAAASGGGDVEVAQPRSTPADHTRGSTTRPLGGDLNFAPRSSGAAFGRVNEVPRASRLQRLSSTVGVGGMVKRGSVWPQTSKDGSTSRHRGEQNERGPHAVAGAQVDTTHASDLVASQLSRRLRARRTAYVFVHLLKLHPQRVSGMMGGMGRSAVSPTAPSADAGSAAAFSSTSGNSGGARGSFDPRGGLGGGLAGGSVSLALGGAAVGQSSDPFCDLSQAFEALVRRVERLSILHGGVVHSGDATGVLISFGAAQRNAQCAVSALTFACEIVRDPLFAQSVTVGVCAGGTWVDICGYVGSDTSSAFGMFGMSRVLAKGAAHAAAVASEGKVMLVTDAAAGLVVFPGVMLRACERMRLPTFDVHMWEVVAASSCADQEAAFHAERGAGVAWNRYNTAVLQWLAAREAFLQQASAVPPPTRAANGVDMPGNVIQSVGLAAAKSSSPGAGDGDLEAHVFGPTPPSRPVSHGGTRTSPSGAFSEKDGSFSAQDASELPQSTPSADTSPRVGPQTGRFGPGVSNNSGGTVLIPSALRGCTRGPPCSSMTPYLRLVPLPPPYALDVCYTSRPLSELVALLPTRIGGTDVTESVRRMASAAECMESGHPTHPKSRGKDVRVSVTTNGPATQGGTGDATGAGESGTVEWSMCGALQLTSCVLRPLLPPCTRLVVDAVGSSVNVPIVLSPPEYGSSTASAPTESGAKD